MSVPSIPELTAADCCADEEWKPIPGWPHHEASTCGRIRSIHRLDADGRLRLGAILPQHPDKRKGKGYLYVNLRDGKRHRRAAVAAVVLEAHRRLRPFPDWEACHGDGVRTDNHLANLRWDTRAANLADKRRHQEERAVTPLPVTRHKTQVRAGMASQRPSRYGVTGDGLKGTVSPPPHSIFPSSPIPLKPLTCTLRTSFRSLRDRMAA